MSATINLAEMQDKNLRMVFFPSFEDTQKVIQMDEFRALHWEVSRGLGPCSVIVPARVVPLIKKRASVTHVLEPTTEANLTLEQVKKMATRKAGFHNFHGTEFFVELEFIHPWKKWRRTNAKEKI